MKIERPHIKGASVLEIARWANTLFNLSIAFDADEIGIFGIRGELDGPLWFNKAVYYERHATEPTKEWISDESIVINGHNLHLNEGGKFGSSLSKEN